MPYVDQDSRKKFKCGHYNYDTIEEVAEKIENCGELNYVVTLLCLHYVKKHGKKYQKYNDVVGALEGAKLELYRRHISPYEDEKIKINGDVEIEKDKKEKL